MKKHFFTRKIFIILSLLLSVSATSRAASNCNEAAALAREKVREFSVNDHVKLCRAAEGSLGSPISDEVYLALSKSVYVISRTSPSKIKTASELASIISLRGQAGKVLDSKNTLDVIVKVFNGTQGRVAPQDLVSFLRGAPSMAKSIDDKGLIAVAAMISVDQ